ncbi:MAG TPA: DsrE family protein [Povalibacter sp.]|nr:DsrE family protein [Povalibacter sp.]
MTTFVLIESRDPFSSDQVAANCSLAGELAASGHTAVLYLVENGVFAARAGVQHTRLAEAASRGVQILVDDFSLRERGIGSAQLAPQMQTARLDAIIDHMLQGARVLWH